MEYGASTAYRPGFLSRLQGAMIQVRDWLDEKGRLAWIAAMIAGFVFVWPVGLAILLYMIGTNRMFACANHRHAPRRYSGSTGNSAFDAYREETLKRLETEHQEFMAFMARLREAKDKAEFDEFMTVRREAANRPTSD